ncbi:MAG: TIGR03936 family radical SAM-associated protein [Caldilineales bacterium]|nr:TIGR03936 family radical SAM-associated protein [Caldilineales bacterium]MCW5858406.1 TIGR03936 family radical SAM-associated protein [Caldilineales bacterium]
MAALAPAAARQRLRLRYAKSGDARFVGHLDEARFWERVCRRAGLPLAYSQAFNPQPKIHFAAALPVGVEGENELLDVWLLEQVAPEAWLPRLLANLPPDFQIHAIAEVALDAPAMQSILDMADYELRFAAEADRTVLAGRSLLAGRVDLLLAQPSLPRPQRKDPQKSYDLRPLIVRAEVLPTAPTIALRLLAAGRITEVVAALGLENHPHRQVRTGLILRQIGE